MRMPDGPGERCERNNLRLSTILGSSGMSLQMGENKMRTVGGFPGGGTKE